MVVNTAPQRHGVTNPTRTLDYLYGKLNFLRNNLLTFRKLFFLDTNYTVSSVKDHSKACNNAQYYDVVINI